MVKCKPLDLRIFRLGYFPVEEIEQLSRTVRLATGWISGDQDKLLSHVNLPSVASRGIYLFTYRHFSEDGTGFKSCGRKRHLLGAASRLQICRRHSRLLRSGLWEISPVGPIPWNEIAWSMEIKCGAFKPRSCSSRGFIKEQRTILSGLRDLSHVARTLCQTGNRRGIAAVMCSGCNP